MSKLFAFSLTLATEVRLTSCRSRWFFAADLYRSISSPSNLSFQTDWLVWNTYSRYHPPRCLLLLSRTPSWYLAYVLDIYFWRPSTSPVVRYSQATRLFVSPSVCTNLILPDKRSHYSVISLLRESFHTTQIPTVRGFDSIILLVIPGNMQNCGASTKPDKVRINLFFKRLHCVGYRCNPPYNLKVPGQIIMI